MNRKQRRAEKKQGRSVTHAASSRVQAMFADAVRHHQAGRVDDAERLYRQILAIDPRHADSLHLLGVVAYQAGRADLAIDLIDRAIAINAQEAAYHSNLSNALKAEGRLDEAAACARRAIDLEPDFAEAHNNLGVAQKGLGKLAEAVACYRQALALRPDFVEAHNNLGNALQDQGKLDEAVACYRQVVVLAPNFAEAHNNLGIALKDRGKLAEAETCYRQALALRPDFVEAHNNLGNALKDSGKLDEAVACYRQVLFLAPNLAEAHNNLGNALHDQGKLDEAVACYRRALDLKPDYADAHNNLGIALKDEGKPDEAAAAFRQALARKPDSIDALNNLASLLITQGKAAVALDLIKQSLHVKEAPETKTLFIDCIARVPCTKDDSEVRTAVVRALTEPWGRPGKLARVSTDIVKLNPAIGACIARAAHAWPQRLSAEELFGSNGFAELAADELLAALLGSAPVSDIEMERFLTMARRLMLEAASRAAASDDVGTALRFYSALARQCFINEYVFCHTDDELRQANDLRDLLAAALESKTRVPALWLVAAAAYFPLSSLPHSARLLDAKWPEAITAILLQQVREPAEEMQLRAVIPRLTNIEDEVSKRVRTQYEENPYPRWVKAEPAGSAYFSVAAYLRQKFPLTPFNRDSESGTEFLIAGCGTGQHAIGTAQSFQGTRVLAVDLSLHSLGYAKRKTQEQGLASIEYGQADLLRLGVLGRSFDVIEAIGVLHHLADPYAGWRTLLSLLRPGGFMRLGLYSEVARRNVAKVRALIAKHGFGTTADEIRRARQQVMDSAESAIFESMKNSLDFFSISACRDLLFHVQERRMQLTGIDAFLRENDLTFVGFEIDGDVLHAYRRRFPDDPAAINLAQWHIFENENPDTFTGMYQLWIQKAG